MINIRDFELIGNLAIGSLLPYISVMPKWSFGDLRSGQFQLCEILALLIYIVTVRFPCYYTYFTISLYVNQVGFTIFVEELIIKTIQSKINTSW